jgi:hypothetical protein
MQASHYHAFVAKRFTLPKAMRIGAAPASNRVTLTPRQFEMTEQHIHHPTSCGATIRISATAFCPLQ